MPEHENDFTCLTQYNIYIICIFSPTDYQHFNVFLGYPAVNLKKNVSKQTVVNNF